MLFTIRPELTGPSGGDGDDFLECVEEAFKALDEGVSPISRVSQLHDKEPGPSDAVVCLTSLEPWPSPYVDELLLRALGNTAKAIPACMTPQATWLPEPIERRNTYAVYERLEDRGLVPQQHPLLADEFASRVLVHLRPTYAPRRATFFLSYPRGDRSFVRGIQRQLERMGRVVRRDFEAIQEGAKPGEAIGELIQDVDTVILIDTPRAASSNWIEWEIRAAQAANVPIIWVRLGSGDNRELPTPPKNEPDIVLTVDATQDELAEHVATQIDAVAYEAQNRGVRSAKRFVTDLGIWARGTDSSFERLDTRKQIYEVVRTVRPNDEKKVHLLQVYGRRATTADASFLAQWLDQRPHGDWASVDDIEHVFLACPQGGAHVRAPNFMSQTSHERYRRLVSDATAPTVGGGAATHPALLLFASWVPGIKTQGHVTEAVRDATSTWIEHGGRIVFGGHPSLTWTVIGAADEAVPRDASRRVTMYQSREFVTDRALKQYDGKAKVVAIDAIPDDTNASLNIMREVMITESGAVAAMAIGGKTEALSERRPGLDEEIQIAIREGIPVVAFGGTGGYAAEIVQRSRSSSPPWHGLGKGLPNSVTEQIADAVDYVQATRTLWDATTT